MTDNTGRKYRVNIDELVEFAFPKNLQHPLASGRLYAFGDCGPLDEAGHLRSGFKGGHVVMDYELEEMCVQYEREDIIQIYLHRPSDMGSLSVSEEEAIIGQADGHLKRAKGKAMLPRITPADVYELFRPLVRDAEGLVSFHDVQRAICEFRTDRIRRYKLVYPNLTKAPGTGASSDSDPATTTLIKKGGTSTRKIKALAGGRVSEAVAPMTMFKHMEGNTNSDLIEQTTKLLSRHAYAIGDGSAQANDLSANVRLLRKPDPRRQTLRMGKPTEAVVEWNATCTFKGTGMGSGVETASSSTTWKRNTTVY